ncbi:hypothetical protein FRC02_006118 [Tulasnella sp. 418]|nr:hypothetical protein FRC02_006118 [Tulasnella sp. 418]
MDPTINTSAVTFNAIEKLVGAANYKRWQEAMKNALMQKGFWRLITEEDKEAHYANDAIKKEDFHKQRIQAMGYIYQNVTISIANRLKNLSSAGTQHQMGQFLVFPKSQLQPSSGRNWRWIMTKPEQFSRSTNSAESLTPSSCKWNL